MENVITTRKLLASEPLPWDLLLLADEEVQAVERYVYQSDVYVVEIDGRIVGTYVLFPIDEHTGEVKAIAVDEEFQNRGIGKLMLKDADVMAEQKGFDELIIGTPTIARKQLSIYRKAGYEMYTVKKNFYLENYTHPIFEDGVRIIDMQMLKKSICKK